MERDAKPRIGIVGLGLIGGSLALALRKAQAVSSLLAWDQSSKVLAEGHGRGVIDGATDSLADLMAQVDVAVLAAPTVACEDLLRAMLQAPGSATCITDVASVKGPLCEAATALGDVAAARYIPGHPIAGSERSGVAAARAELFAGHRVILTPQASSDPVALATVAKLWQAAGASVATMAVDEHDAVLAATSHLPHVLAYALVDALARSDAKEDVFRFAAGGFRDFTRIASSDPIMWRDIALANRDALLTSIDDFSDRLGVLRQAIAQGDGAALEATFRNAKEARDEFARELQRRTAGDDPDDERATPSSSSPD